MRLLNKLAILRRYSPKTAHGLTTLYQRASNFWATDLSLLVFCFISTLLILLSTGFDPAHFLLGSFDIAGQHLPFYRFPYRHLPQEYWIDIEGGTLGHSVYGMPFFYWLYTTKLLSLKNYFFLFHLAIMAALPYFTFKILAYILPRQRTIFTPYQYSSNVASGSPWPPWATFFIIFSLAATPAMGSKIIAGHDNIILGTIFFFLILSLILAAWEKRFTITHLVFSLIILLQIFPYYNYHMLHTAIFYGWPFAVILLGLYPRQNQIIHPRGPHCSKFTPNLALINLWNTYRVPLLLVFGAFAICFYQFYGMYVAFTGFEHRYETVDGAEHVSSLGRIVNERIGYDGVRQTAVEILEMPVITVRIDGVRFDLVRPVCPIDRAFFSQRFIYRLAGFACQVVVRDLRNNAMTFLPPSERRYGAHGRKERSQQDRKQMSSHE